LGIHHAGRIFKNHLLSVLSGNFCFPKLVDNQRFHFDGLNAKLLRKFLKEIRLMQVDLYRAGRTMRGHDVTFSTV
jgi:hypothetical protein